MVNLDNFLCEKDYFGRKFIISFIFPFVYQILERYGNDLIHLNLMLLQVVGGKWRGPWSSLDCYG